MPGHSRSVPSLRLQSALLLASWFCLAALLPGTAQAGGWMESAQGDLSNNGLVPQVVAVTPGSNTFQGTTGRDAASGVVDRDYFTVTVPAGFELSSMLVLPGTAAIGSGSFMGLMSGSVFSVPPTSATADGLMGWTIFGEDNLGGDLLLYMAAPSLGSSGFTAPLPAGSYSFWVQETGTGVAGYAFGMDITAAAPVPEPATALTLLAGVALLAAATKRR